jgi:hypothetical protein
VATNDKKDVDDHPVKKYWRIVRREQVPTAIKALPAVWGDETTQTARTAREKIYK